MQEKTTTVTGLFMEEIPDFSTMKDLISFDIGTFKTRAGNRPFARVIANVERERYKLIPQLKYVLISIDENNVIQKEFFHDIFMISTQN